MHTVSNDAEDMKEMAIKIAHNSLFLSPEIMEKDIFIASQRWSARSRMQQLLASVDGDIFACYTQEFNLHGHEAQNVLLLPHSLVPDAPSEITSDCSREQSLEPLVRTLFVCHTDHRAGYGAVDNASGMAVAKMALELCQREEIQAVGLLVCDGEESGRKGSQAFLSVLPLIADTKSTNIVNVDSLEIGEVVELHSEYQVAPRISTKCLPRIHLPTPNTDADTFHREGYRTLTLTTHNSQFKKDIASCLALPLRMDFKDFLSRNVCNSEDDTIDALCQENMERALGVVMRMAREHQACLR